MRIKFEQTPNGNMKGSVKLTATEGIDIIKFIETGLYKIKPYEIIREQKVYVKNLLIRFGEFPTVSKEEVREVIEEISKLTTDEED